jgi:hypothetical protein
MCKDDSIITETLELDDLDGVTGGTVIRIHGRNPETAEVICPKCKSKDIAGVDVTDFARQSEGFDFLQNTNLMCNKCHYFAKGTKFKRRVL